MEPRVYYKQVACVQGKLFSIYDKNIEYEIGVVRKQTPKANHKAGYFVYSSQELAANAEIQMKLGTNWIFPRVLLKVECWGEMIQYPKFKLCFEYIKPIENLGFPKEYLKEKKEKKKSREIKVKTMKKETKILELEVAEMETKARKLGIFFI